MSPHLVCIDPDDGAREATVDKLRTELSAVELTVDTGATLAAGENALRRETAVVITEYDLPDGTGFDLIRATDERCPDAGCILYTDTDPATLDTTGLRGTLTEYVGKDSLFGADRLSRLVRTTIDSATQRSYPLPQSESERLAALSAYELDEDALRTSLDRMTDLAARHFDVEIASINIINEHSQDFLACYGPAAEWDTMDREDSICTFTILEETDVMTVEDVTADPRFASRSEELRSLGIRSYMGAKMMTAGGLSIGSLCVYDDVPRSFSPADQAYLADLAATSMDLIELHTRVSAAGGSR